MLRQLPLLLVCAVALVACGDAALLQDANGTWRVVAQLPAASTALAAAAKQHAPLAAVVACDDGALRAARAVIAAEPTLREVRLVGVGVLPAGGPSSRETIVVEPTAGQAAIELALLACNGLPVPPRLHVGTRVVDAANAAAGGTLRPAPGDLALAMLRREHASVITTKPDTDVVFAVAFVQLRADAWHDRVRDEVVAAAKRHPQLDLQVHGPAGDAAHFTALVQHCLDANVRALVIAADDWQALAPLAAAADERRIARLGIDPRGAAAHVSCSLGADQEVLGRALGEAVKTRLPGGGALLEIGDCGAASLRQQGFVKALGLQAK